MFNNLLFSFLFIQYPFILTEYLLEFFGSLLLFKLCNIYQLIQISIHFPLHKFYLFFINELDKVFLVCTHQLRVISLHCCLNFITQINIIHPQESSRVLMCLNFIILNLLSLVEEITLVTSWYFRLFLFYFICTNQSELMCLLEKFYDFPYVNLVHLRLSSNWCFIAIILHIFMHILIPLLLILFLNCEFSGSCSCP